MQSKVKGMNIFVFPNQPNVFFPGLLTSTSLIEMFGCIQLCTDYGSQNKTCIIISLKKYD